MLALLKSRLVVAVAGLLLLALFLWFAGPLFAFADYRPLQSETVRLVVIAAAVAAWLGWTLVRRLRASRASDRLMAAVVRQSEKEAPSAQMLQLRERFEEAVGTLRQRRKGGHSLYDLPWYVIVGAPGAGKTTVLLNSGLHFPIEQRTGRGALRGVGGTRNCDWWFTDEAVFLDTAGRFMTQDSDPHADGEGWGEFLTLLRAYRERRPLNGVILAISAQDLLVQSRAAREAHVDAVRRRLDELNERLGLRLPVYVLVTKCDLVSGFTEYFNDLTQDGREQVWGVTFPVEQTRNSDAAQAVPREMDALIERLNARVFARVEDERDVTRRARAFGFPQQMTTLRDPLAEFMTDVFAATRFDRALLLRGVYFTSGTQEGTPIDRLLGSLGRRFAVAADAVRASGSRGKAYFIERLLKEVVIPESGLAGLNRRLEMRKAALQLGAYAAIAALAVAGVIFMSVSYARGQGYIDRVQEALDTAARTGEIAPDSPRAAIVRRLDALHGVTAVAGQAYAPWYARWGLYQGRAIGEAAHDAYIREMNAALLPRIRTSLERRIQSAPEPEELYEYLKGYLMLGEGDVARADPDPLAYLEWDEPGAGDALSQHLLRLLESKPRMRPVALDEVVVRQARSTIRNASIPQLVYRTVIRAYEGDARALRLDIESGIGAAQVLRFRSGRPLTQPVSSLYTKPVFQEVAGPDALEEVVNKYATELWVWGEAGAPETSYDAVRTAVLDLYESDYIAQWDGILNDLEVVSMPTLRSLKEGLSVLAGPKSPLRGLLTVVDRHTYLVEEKDPEEEPGLIDGVIKRIPLPGASREAARPPGSRVTEHFAAIHRAVTGPPGGAPIDATLETLGRIRDTLATTGDAVGEKPADPATQLTTRELARTLEAGAEQLPPTASSISRQVARTAVAVVNRGAGDYFERLYQEQVLRECEAVTRGFYPFVPSSPNDVPLADFAALFGYDGVFDRFFAEELQKYADATATPWRWRPESPVRSSALLRQFERADRIRRTFFTPGSRDVQLEFRLQITDASSERFVLEIDGQTFDFRHFLREPDTVQWPGTGSGMAIATFHQRGGRTERLPDRPYEGAWAWFRLLDAASVQADGDVTSRYALRFAKGANWATARVEALRVRNPFGGRADLRGFGCRL